ncbi:Uncharacterised protein at_DN0321 [Pycnogonum litorale]
MQTLVDKEEVIFKVNTEVNILPEQYANDIVRTNTKLQMWNNTTTAPVGTCHKIVKNPKNAKKYSVEFTVVTGMPTPLIGLRSAVQIELIEILDKNLEEVFVVNRTDLDLFPNGFS